MNRTLIQFNMPLFNIPFIITGMGFVSFISMTIGLGIIAYFMLEISIGGSILAGILGLLSHIITDLVHQYGHYRAGKRAGYPMNRLRTFYFIILGLYPDDEPDLPPEVHLQRAWGGPVSNAIYIVIVVVITYLLWNQGGVIRFVMAYTSFESIVLLVVSLYPPVQIGEMTNDGMIIRKYRAMLREDQS